MLRDTRVGLIEPMLRSAGVHCSRAGFSSCCSRHRTIDPQCLENPRPAGAESTLTENARSPFHAEPRHVHVIGHQVHFFDATLFLLRQLAEDLPPVAISVRLALAIFLPEQL